MAGKDEAHEAFTSRLREAMDAAGVDQRELARRLEIDEAAVSRWFNKGQMPQARILARMPQALGVSVDWLVGAPKATRPNHEAVHHAVDEALRRARASLRDEIVRAVDAWAERQERARKR